MTTLKAVIGANYGDEGKGRMVDYFASKAEGSCIVVCTNGGAQRGHTVVTDNGRLHIFHHFGSGTLAGADTYLPATFIVNPIIFMEEYKQLTNCRFIVYVNPNCLCSTPFDMVVNQIIEESRGANKHGSCGVGIWETILRNGATIGEMLVMTDEKLRTYLCGVRDTYFIKRLSNKKIDNVRTAWKQVYYSQGLIEHYINDFKEMRKHIILEDDNVLFNYENVIFENGQGLLLDQNIHNSQWSTPSNTGSENIRKIVDNTFGDNYESFEVCYVTRTYITKHGAGDFPEEIDYLWFDVNRLTETNVWNKNQGEFRYGKLNVDEFKRRANEDFDKHLRDTTYAYKTYAITHTDEYPVFMNNEQTTVYYSFGAERNKVKRLCYST